MTKLIVNPSWRTVSVKQASLAHLLAIFCVLAGMGLLERSQAAVGTSARDAFATWLADYGIHKRSGFGNQNEAQSIRQLAQARAAEMRRLMEVDPEQFVKFSLPAAVVADLPTDLQPWLEQRAKDRGLFAVYCTLANPNDSSQSERHSHDSYTREVVMNNGTIYKAFVFGNWKQQATVNEATIEGIILQDAIVLGGAPTPAEQEEAGDPVILSQPQLTGTNTLLYIVAKFSNEASYPIDDATALSHMSGVNDFWLNNSSGQVAIHGLTNASQLMDIVYVTLPRPTSYTPTYNNSLLLLLNDARTAATALGYNYTNYNLDVVVTSNPGFSYAGRANIGSQGVHLVKPNTTLRTAGHELSHNFGLRHANYWRSDAVQAFGKDSVPVGYVGDTANGEWVEYGHYFSLMSAQSSSEMDDPAKPHFAPAEKVALGWLGGDEVRYVTNSGTYRLFRHDNRDTVGSPRAIRIESPATDYTSLDRRYWLGYRFAPWATAQGWFRNGLQIDVAQPAYSGDGAIMLDMTPYSRDAASPFFDPFNKPASYWTIDNNDKLDGALLLGRTYSDSTGGIHLTPILTGNNGDKEEYIDVVINLGNFPSNRPPIISAFFVSTNQAAIGEAVSFSVSASDPDGDSLAHSWDFDEVQVWTLSGLNNPVATKSWPTPGQYRVTATVSDMRGGTAIISQIVTVGTSSDTNQIWGRVVWGGKPVSMARISATAGSTVFQSWTDAEGSYVLTDLPSTNSYTLNCQKDGLTFAKQFSNPVSVASANAYGRDFYANELLPVHVGLPTYVVSGQISYAGNPVSGAQVFGGDSVVTSDSQGKYQFTNLTSGTYTLTAAYENWTFSPSQQSVTVPSANLNSNDFARLAPFSVSGRLDGLPTGLQDTPPDVILSNGRRVAATLQGAGQTQYWGYTLTEIPAGSYSLISESFGYRVTPVGFTNPLSVAVNLTNMDFSATVSSINRSISGRITERGAPLGGVFLQASKSGTNAGSAFTDSDGYFTIPNLANSSFLIVPSLATYTFSPASINAFAGTVVNFFSATGPNPPPVISSVTATPTVVSNAGSTATLLATASGTPPLSYSWDAVAAHAPVMFSANHSTNAASTSVSFQNPGNYTFRVRATDGNSLSVTSLVSLIVSAAPGGIVVAPYQVQVTNGCAVVFHADIWDEVGNRLSGPADAWSVSGGGTIDSNGTFLATTPGGPYAIMAAAGSLSATGFVWITGTTAAPNLTIISLGLGAYLIRGNGTPGLQYQIESSDTPTGNWSNLGSATADAFGFFELTNSSAPGQRFYRSVYP